MWSDKILHGHLTLLPSQGLTQVKNLFSFSELVRELLCSQSMFVLLQWDMHYSALPAFPLHLGNEVVWEHKITVPFTPRVWMNTNKLETVQLKVTLSCGPHTFIYLLVFIWKKKQWKNRKGVRVRGDTSKALQLNRGEGRGEGRHWQKNYGGEVEQLASLLCEIS